MTVKHLYPTSAPSLSLNFKSSGVADPRISCTRSTTATYVDAVTRLIKTAAANVARVGEDGLLVEESRSNVLKRSESMWHSDWADQVTGNGGSATQSSTDVDPSGNNNALKTVSKSSASSYHAIYQNGSLSNSTTYTFSVYAKANGYNFIGMSLGSPCATSGVFFNLSTGAVGTTNGSGWTSKITTARNGWYRCEVTKTTNNESYPQIETHSADNQGSYTGDGSSGVLLWGAQCEQGSFSTSYIPTSGSTVTRNADEVELTGTNFSSWFAQSQGTIFCEWADTDSSDLVQIWEARPRFSYGIFDDVPNNRCQFFNGSNSVYVNGQSPRRSTLKAALGYTNTSLIGGSFEGTTTGTTATTKNNTPTSITFCRHVNNGGVEGSTPIASLYYYSARASNVQLQALTQ